MQKLKLLFPPLLLFDALKLVCSSFKRSYKELSATLKSNTATTSSDTVSYVKNASYMGYACIFFGFLNLLSTQTINMVIALIFFVIATCMFIYCFLRS